MKAVLRTMGPFVGFALLLGAAACETEKSANPLSPAIAGPMEGVEIGQPKLLEPVANQQIKDKDQPLTVIIENPGTTSPRPYKLRLQIATDINFSKVAWSREGITPGSNGQTKFKMPEKLTPGRVYFWRAQADDGANVGAWSAPRGFEILKPTFFGKPSPRSPVGNEKVSTNRPVLTVDNAKAEGPVGQAYYHFQVSRNSSFSDLVFNQQTPQQGGQTKITTSALDYSASYFWRVRVSDGETTGEWSETETFRTGTKPAPKPSPDSGPGSGTACGAPYPSTPLSIIQCQRSKYSGQMSQGQIVQFLIASAKDLNKQGHFGGGFGILEKDSGHNCSYGGTSYSCDILCLGHGSGQRQFDVLGDADGAQVPGWAEVGTVAVRPCHVQ